MRHHGHHHEEHDHDDFEGRRGSGRGEFGRGFGGQGFGGPPFRGGRGPRSRRGDIRIALLSALTDGPGHGYQLIQRLEERSGGRWRPSPGSVYPTLQLLEDSGFVTATQQDDKRVFAITEAGQAELARLVEQSGMPPWATDAEGPGGHGELRRAIAQLALASKQVTMAGNPAHVEAATGILNEARRKLYQLLAEA
jgi:DNA-binding PadR family transcriptional regulator